MRNQDGQSRILRTRDQLQPMIGDKVRIEDSRLGMK